MFAANYLKTHQRRIHPPEVQIPPPDQKKREYNRQYRERRKREQLALRSDSNSLSLTRADGIAVYTDGHGGIYAVEKLR
jgi:hypothetical protein